MLDWYVAKIKARSERGVELSLARCGAESYIPEIVVRKRGRQSLEPLFPGYVFVHTDTASDLWRRVRWAQGIRYFLPDHRDPASVGQALVGDLRSRVADWNGGGWTRALRPGAPVRIETGVLKGLEAIFSRYVPGHQRCEVLISMIGRDHHVTLETRSLALVSGEGAFRYAPAL